MLLSLKKQLSQCLAGLLLLLAISTSSLYAQEGRQMQERSPDADIVKPSEVKRSPFRAILNKVTLGVNAGYGLNYYRQNIPYVVMRQGETHYLSPSGASTSWYSKWLTNSQFSPLAANGPEDAKVSGDTTDLRMLGIGHSLPLGLDLHVVLMERFRIGGGIGMEMFSIRPLSFKNDGGVLGQYHTDIKSSLAWRYYGMLGTRVISWGNWDHTVDVRLGKKKFLGQHFQKVHENTFFNLGFMMERQYSEYFRLTLRPSVEWFSFKSSLESIGNMGELEELKTSAPAFYFQAGISINYPRLPRCPIKACHTQLEHLHNGKEFRGQPIHKWQNPKYGQNHPELQRNLKRDKDDTEQRLQKRPKRRH